MDSAAALMRLCGV